ncbi:MAG: hypothetical protein RMJ07_01860 [Nitrososphaerota archaeon]|nr:hypothetical protein [Candidatus Bathyarchaeota archaeon]MDW8048414.1 hypothetical protein [Nitrososphaerota archaeon]
MKTKTIAFVGLMGALANILFIISYHVGPIVPGVSLDLSHISIFVASIYGGPLTGLLTGVIGGILPGVYYGPLGSGGWLGLIGLPVGKALSGLTAGILSRSLWKQKSGKSLVIIPMVLASYVPECIFTIVYFVSLLPFFIGRGGTGLLAFVLPKAWAEIIFISVFMAALAGNTGFNSFVNSFFLDQKSESGKEVERTMLRKKLPVSS